MNRLQQILLGLFIVQIILAVVVFIPRGGAAQQVEPLLSNFKADDTVKISIDDYDKNHVDLIKEGSAWEFMLGSGDTYPTQGEEAQNLLSALEKVKTNRMVTRTQTSHKQLKVSDTDFVRYVTLETKDGTKFTFYIGTSPGNNTSHVRLAGKNEVYLASLDSMAFGATANTWVDTTYLSVGAETISAVTLKNEHGTLEFTKDASGMWKLKGIGDKDLDENKVSTLINRLSNVRMTTP